MKLDLAEGELAIERREELLWGLKYMKFAHRSRQEVLAGVETRRINRNRDGYRLYSERAKNKGIWGPVCGAHLYRLPTTSPYTLKYHG